MKYPGWDKSIEQKPDQWLPRAGKDDEIEE